MLIRRWLIASLLTLLSIAACAEDATTSFEEGKHYVRLDTPVRTVDPNKIEVTEVFWYGCSHCFHFEPMVHAWSKKLPKDVEFVQSPAMWNRVMEIHARAFYTAKALRVLDKVHQPIFEAINVERNMLTTPDAIATLFAKYGVEESTFHKAFKSFAVNSQVQQADARARGYQIQGTPEMIVNGKFRVSTRTAGSQRGMLEVVDYLVQQERNSAQ
ncbi:thiol:disulfide interchange protein DsbA/DsbL [Litorivivens sp.]|uniref:thiol:disulfide interchange protein DsbA/DsbL n=1 Tax=Litorivivens sp. TaxID=2020868 RepID=UPI0035668D2B